MSLHSSPPAVSYYISLSNCPYLTINVSFQLESGRLLSNVATIRDASHFVATDIPTFFSRTNLKRMVRTYFNLTKSLCHPFQLTVLEWLRPQLGPMLCDTSRDSGPLSVDMMAAFFGNKENDEEGFTEVLKKNNHRLLWGSDFIDWDTEFETVAKIEP